MKIYQKLRNILESYDINFDFDRDEAMEDHYNKMVPFIKTPSETRVFHSERMRNNGLELLRLTNEKNQIEYHLNSKHISPFTTKTPGEDQDPTSVRHALSIVKNDAKQQLNNGREVKIQCLPHRKAVYGKIIRSMIKDGDYDVDHSYGTVYGYHENVPTFIIKKRT